MQARFLLVPSPSCAVNGMVRRRLLKVPVYQAVVSCARFCSKGS
jgi:hypothetical protein